MHGQRECNVCSTVICSRFAISHETKGPLTMIKLSRLLPLMLATSIVAAGSAGATEPVAPAEKDPLRGVLAESKDKNRGVTIYTHGSSIAMVVTAIDDRYVIGRSQQATRIVVRLDQIDGVAGMF